jgi:LysM repeat protein
MRIKPIILGLLALCLSGAVQAADTPELRDDHPERYTVQPGDTLWDISSRFLTEPWLWPEIWYENPRIENPHLIYPGDVIKLTTVAGEPRLTADRGGGTVKLSPEVRSQDLDEAVRTIPVSAIRPFLTGNRLVAKEAYEGAPYILAGSEERVLAGTGDPIYVRGLPESPSESWDVLRKGDPLIDPANNEVLGYEATKVGSARIEQMGDPATLRVNSVTQEIMPGDRLFQSEERGLKSRFTPRAPDTDIQGQIMAVMAGVTQVGQFDVVAINLGTEDNAEVGHVLRILKQGRTVEDEYSKEEEQVQLPDEPAGELIIFRTYEKMSFALVMEASRAMKVNDIVRTP